MEAIKQTINRIVEHKGYASITVVKDKVDYEKLHIDFKCMSDIIYSKSEQIIYKNRYGQTGNID